MLARRVKPVSKWRRALRVLSWLLLILLLPVVVWWVANRFDEPPSPAALRLSAPAPRAVADADNAWLHLVGIGAAPAEDPVAYGRRRVDALSARIARSPTPLPDAAEKALFADAVPAVIPDASLDGTAELCPMPIVDCIEWAARHQPMLQRLRDANALRLERFERVLQLREWQGLYPASLETPFPDSSVATLYRNLLAADMARALESGAPGGPLQAVTKLADFVEFWRRVPLDPPDLVSVMIASTQVEAAHRLAGDLLDRVAWPIGRDLEQQFDRVLQPLAGPIGWQRALVFEYGTFVHAMSAEFPGTWGAVRQCFDRSAEDGCLKSLAMQAAYVPQATFNLHARNMEAMQRWLEADAREVESARAAYGAEVEKSFIQFEDYRALLRQMAYNFTGRVLVSIAIPASDWGLRIHDREALRRMLALERDALRKQVPASAMTSFLDAQPEALRNPYDGEAFAWDGLFREIQFEPKAGTHWKRPRLGVAYLASQAPAGAGPCSADFEFDLTEGAGDGANRTLQFVSCGNGQAPRWTDAVDPDELADPRTGARRRYYWIDARREGNEVGLRLLHDDGERLRRYQSRLTLGDDVAGAQLDPIGHEGGPQVSVRVRPVR